MMKIRKWPRLIERLARRNSMFSIKGEGWFIVGGWMAAHPVMTFPRRVQSFVPPWTQCWRTSSFPQTKSQAWAAILNGSRATSRGELWSNLLEERATQGRILLTRHATQLSRHRDRRGEVS